MTRSRLAALAQPALAGFFGVRLHGFLAAASRINAKVLCSAVFVSDRVLEEARANSLLVDPPAMSVRADEERREVRVEVLGLIRRTARHYGDQGCIALPRGVDEIAFTPVEPRSALADPRTRAWPMGDAEDRPRRAFGDGIDPGKLAEALDLAFADPGDLTAAFLVVHRGRIAAERYAPGIRRVFVVPSHDLVIVRMGHTRGGANADTNLRAAQSLILEAIQAPKDAG